MPVALSNSNSKAPGLQKSNSTLIPSVLKQQQQQQQQHTKLFQSKNLSSKSTINNFTRSLSINDSSSSAIMQRSKVFYSPNTNSNPNSLNSSPLIITSSIQNTHSYSKLKSSNFLL